MKSPQIRGFFAAHEIKFGEIAAALKVDVSYISHAVAYRKRNQDLQHRIEQYVRQRVNRPKLVLFDRGVTTGEAHRATV